MIFNCALALLISFFGTIPYAARLVGIKTGHLALTFSLFNVIMFISRTSAGLQAPFLAKLVEGELALQSIYDTNSIFRFILLSSTAGCLLGIAFIPFTERIFSAGVRSYYHHRSFYTLIKKMMTANGITLLLSSLKISFSIPKINYSLKDVSIKLLIYHTLATALFTTGLLSAIYAGCLNPAFRATSATLTFVVHGIATLVMFLFIDPPVSILTDDCISGKLNENVYRKTIYLLVISRISGTLISQLVFLPISHGLSLLATLI